MAMSNGVTSGNFATLADLQASKVRVDTQVSLNGIDYTINTVNFGDGLVVNSFFANPVIGTTISLINSTLPANTGDIRETSGFTTSGDGGGAKWKFTGVTGQTSSQTPAQLVNALLNDANGNQWELIKSSTDIIDKLGLSEDSLRAAITAYDNVDLNGNILTFTTTRTTISTLTGSVKNGVLNITLSDTSFRALFFLNGGGFIDTEINITIPQGGSVELFRPVGDDSYITNCNIDGGVTDNGTIINGDSYLVQADSTKDVKNFKLNKNKIKNVSYVHLKTNLVTTRQDGWETNFNTFTGIYKEGVGLNSPSGLCDNFQVIGNSFLTHKGIDLGFYSLYIACASGENIQIKNNYFEGVVDQCIHIEEAANNFTITGNTGGVDCKGGVIAFNENNVGGTLTHPKRIIVSNNVFTKSGINRESASVGLWLTNNVSTEPPAENTLISNNIFSGFEIGYSFDSYIDNSFFINNNYAIDCTSGYSCNNYMTGITNNVSQDCQNAIINTSSAVCDIKDHTATRCNNLSTGRFNFNNLTVNFPAATFTAAQTQRLSILPEASTTKIKGTFKTSAIYDIGGVNTSGRINSVLYDGTTLTNTNELTNEDGIIQTDIVLNSGFLKMEIFSVLAGIVQSSLNINGFINIQG